MPLASLADQLNVVWTSPFWPIDAPAVIAATGALTTGGVVSPTIGPAVVPTSLLSAAATFSRFRVIAVAGRVSVIARPVAVRALQMLLAEAFGLVPARTATAPETCGAAIEVPWFAPPAATMQLPGARIWSVGPVWLKLVSRSAPELASQRLDWP